MKECARRQLGSTLASQLDIASNRSAVKYPRGVMIRRVFWAFGRIFFHLSPRPFFSWRSLILKLFGAKVGRNVHIYSSVMVYMPWNLEIGAWSSIGEHAFIYNLGKITIGERVTISHRAHLCAGTHDYTRSDLPLLKPPIQVGDQAWICADAFVGPDVTVGEGAIIGARAVAVEDVPAWTIVAGNPARAIKKRELQG